jgi:hypothetical protein
MSGKKAVYYVVLAGLLAIIVASCASVQKEVKGFQGIMGKAVPTDEYGNEIVPLEKEKILINIVPVRDGVRLFEKSSSFNPKPDGTFMKELGTGKYTIEVFLVGFYVRSLDIVLHEREVLNLGLLQLQRIETDPGSPVMGEENDDMFLNGGDVNIEPPSI